MTLSQTEYIKKALLKVEMIEIDKMILLPDVNFKTSEEYNDFVNKIINNERKRENSLLKLSFRKKLIILIASILVMLAIFTACIFGKQIKGFFIDILEYSSNFSASSDGEKSTYKEYDFSYIPPNFKIKDTYRTPYSFEQVYYNEEFYLYLDQGDLNSQFSIHINTEGKGYDILNIGKYKVYYTNNKHMHILIWEINDNYFSITCSDAVSLNEIEQIVLGVKEN